MATKQPKPAAKAKKPAKALSPLKAWKASPGAMDEIVDFVAAGNSLLAFTTGKGFPYNTVLDWINDEPARIASYARAREARADVKFEELADVSDAAVLAETAVEVAGLRLKADNIKWTLARMSPRFSDKLQIGQAPDLPPFSGISDADLDARIKALSGGSST